MTTAQERMNRTYVLVHGASGGGWDWKTMDDLLSADGHTVEDRSTDPSWQVAQKRGWTIQTLESDHNAQRSHPEQLNVLLEAAPNIN